MKNTKLNLNPIEVFSHELKSPLSSLKMSLNIIKKNPASPESKQALLLMEEELNGLIDFIHTQLDLKLIKEKKDLLKFQWSLWKPSLLKSLNSCRLLAREKNISFQINGQSDIDRQKDFEIFMDSQWVTQVLINLLSNALKFSPKDSRVFIDYEFLQEGVFLCAVTNEGERFPEEDSNKLFEAFYTRTSKMGDKGTGLGLTLAKMIIERHGGSIKAFSSKEDGRGAVFSFTLPKARTVNNPAA